MVLDKRQAIHNGRWYVTELIINMLRIACAEQRHAGTVEQLQASTRFLAKEHIETMSNKPVEPG